MAGWIVHNLHFASGLAEPMSASSLLVVVLWFPSVVPAAPLVPVESSASTTKGSAKAEPADLKLPLKTPPQLVAESLAARPGAALAGAPLSLAEALAATPDRPGQIEAIRAYWRLAEAVAEYHYAADANAQLQQLTARANDALVLATAQASAAAALGEAELTVIAAQHDMISRAAMARGAGLPLPADRPHAGPYRTSFQQFQVMRPLSPRAALVDQSLPVARRALDLRAAALSRAEQSVEAGLKAYRAERLDCAALLARMAELRRQRLLFLALVQQYNNDIADYALEVAEPSIAGPALVAMLIENPAGAVRPSGYETESAPSLPAPGGPQPVEALPNLIPAPATGATGKKVPVIRLDAPAAAPPGGNGQGGQGLRAP